MVRGIARNTRRGIVLLRSADVIWKIGGRLDAVDLGRGIALIGPRFAPIHRDRGAAVVAVDDPSRVGRVDPEIVVVRVRPADFRETGAAVGRFQEDEVQDVNRLSVRRVCHYS